MPFSKQTLEKFAKLSISSVSELALFAPYKYEDLTLHQTLQDGKEQLIDATIESVYKAPNSLQITFYVHNFSHTLQGVIFKPKPYMLHQFCVGQRDYYYGKIECKGGGCSMSMPKRVTLIGSIIPKYKAPLRSDVLYRLIQQELTLEALKNEGIAESIASEILSLHFPQPHTPPPKQLTQNVLEALKYVELYSYMRMLAVKRRYFPASFTQECSYKEWSASLPFTLTTQQCNAIEDIQNDFTKGVAAKRMVVGDVGSGKTMVILASAYMVGSAKSILMAPTTILANQLYEEAVKFLPNLRVVLVTNKTKKVDLREYDCIIGTHALLYRELPQAALVMVDEQHRFGTQQRNMLEKLVAQGEKRPHYIQFSATPIPRTQAMIESAHIDVSLITTTPFSKDIDTKVIHKEDFSDLIEHIQNEIAKKNQVLLVYPLVEQSEAFDYQSIDEARGYWEKNFNNVYVTHGKDKHKEDVLLEFRDKGDILIATTVVEVGISLPRLTTVVIVGAERLGLSTLHQLRGRVSRTGLKGYCFLYTKQNTSKRLDEFAYTTSGFDIANLDLKYRKSGDLLKGSVQSGSRFKWIDMAEDEQIVQRVQRDLSLYTKDD